jgi:hypothetical protein
VEKQFFSKRSRQELAPLQLPLSSRSLFGS